MERAGSHARAEGSSPRRSRVLGRPASSLTVPDKVNSLTGYLSYRCLIPYPLPLSRVNMRP
eukprot:4301381-Pyramimonas_sp.AAC.1